MGTNKELTFDDFRHLASDQSLSKYEKIGFPDSYRKGIEPAILDDISSKLDLYHTHGKLIADIGCGCSDLVMLEIELCKKQNHRLILIDSEEMLNQVKSGPETEKIPGFYPDLPELFERYTSKIDLLIAYSLLHYVFNQNNMYGFIHRSVDLLKPGGKMLIGDIPNFSKRNRFLMSEPGKKFAAAQSEAEKGSTAHENNSEKIDDAILFSIMQRFRNFNCETYLLPQNENLPMANRREDLLIVKR